MGFFEKLVRFLVKKELKGALYTDDSMTIQYSLINGLEYESQEPISEIDIFECLSLAVDFGECEDGWMVYRP